MHLTRKGHRAVLLHQCMVACNAHVAVAAACQLAAASAACCPLFNRQSGPPSRRPWCGAQRHAQL